MNFHFEIQKSERMWTCESLAEFHKAGWITDVLYQVKGARRRWYSAAWRDGMQVET